MRILDSKGKKENQEIMERMEPKASLVKSVSEADLETGVEEEEREKLETEEPKEGLLSCYKTRENQENEEFTGKKESKE